MNNTQIFTPSHIINQILDDIGYNTPQNIIGKSILEPSCGDGNFLVEIVSRIISVSDESNIVNNLQNITAFEIDEDLINITLNRLNELISDLDVTIEWNLYCKDALTLIESDKKFDYVVGNPPYQKVHDIGSETKDYIKKYYKYSNYFMYDLYFSFLELSYRVLSENGILGMITPNTWHKNSTSAKKLYKWLQPHIIKLIDFNSQIIFEGFDTYTSICIIQKNNYTRCVTQSNTQSNTQNIIIHVGIQTNNDSYFIFNDYTYLDNTVLIKTPLGYYEFETELIKPIIKVSKYQGIINQVIFYPYNPDFISINNIEKYYPQTFKYVCELTKYHSESKYQPHQFKRQYQAYFGNKIIFSPITNNPTFHYIEDKNCDITFYSGYCILTDGNYIELCERLNSPEIKQKIISNAKNLKNGYFNITKDIVIKSLH